MSNFKSYKERSRENWGTSSDSMTIEQIQLGTLIRIADGVELMAKRYQDLLSDRDWWKNVAEERGKREDLADRRNAALRGHITRLKKSK